SVYLDKKKIIKSDYPILGVSSLKETLAVEVIKDYRTPLLFYSINGDKVGEEIHDNIQFMDSEGHSLFMVETSFNYKFKVSRRVKEKSETIMQYGNYDVKVTDIYVKGDVLLHGFLLSKSNNPKGVIVYGYGGFRISLLPSFPMFTRILLDEGYSVLITNLRGGYENGEEWHKAGMLLNKKNVFKDFSEFLRLVKSLGGKTIAMGGSNGGLLVGATENEYPELIDCAVIGHPVLDMLRYDKLYVGKYWVEEYGDPNDPKYRDYLLSYSPYHNLKKGLQKTFVYTGINDDRVHPAHA
ncbi:MAG: prolyl oligopeptidase family serine peptidase, partial [Acidianus infernus]|nr:prolyl oligopeptidase family serine peptidase [Acidianus infernus]